MRHPNFRIHRNVYQNRSKNEGSRNLIEILESRVFMKCRRTCVIKIYTLCNLLDLDILIFGHASNLIISSFIIYLTIWNSFTLLYLHY